MWFIDKGASPVIEYSPGYGRDGTPTPRPLANLGSFRWVSASVSYSMNNRTDPLLTGFPLYHPIQCRGALSTTRGACPRIYDGQ